MNSKTLATAALAVIAMLALGACGKKNTSSASTPATQACVFNPTYGYPTYPGTATACNPTAQGTTTCPAAPNNYYTNAQGQMVQCTPGQVVPSTGYGYNYPGQYPYPNYMNQTGCDQWTYQYGIQYVPVVLQGSLQCVRIDVLAGSSYGTNYGYNQDYYYYAPPYSGNQCSTGIDFGGNWGYLGICF